MSFQIFNDRKNELFGEILEYEKGLFSPSKVESLDTCLTIVNHFKSLTQTTKKAIELNSSNEKATASQLIANEMASSITFQTWQSSEKNLLDLKVKSASLESKEKNLEKTVDEAKQEVKKVKSRITQAETNRRDALIDMIPLVGIFTGLFTKRYTRMIPFYSSIVGLVSVCKKDLESFRSTLTVRKTEHKDIKNQISLNDAEILQTKNDIDNKKEEIEKLEKRRLVLEEETKKAGKNLTELRNVEMSLKELETKYKFLQMDVENIKEYIEADFFEEEIVKNFIQDVKRVQMINF